MPQPTTTPERERGTATLVISCPDRQGLVASVAQFIAEHRGNILHSDQHTDPEDSIFLQRIEFELDDFDLRGDEFAERFAPLAARFDMRWSIHRTRRRPRIALLVSKLGHCLYDLMARQAMRQLRGEIVGVGSNHEDLRGAAERFGLSYRYLPIGADGREAQEARLLDWLEELQVDLVVLARYMQVLGPNFVSRYAARSINIHHSFLPAFVGGRPYHQAHRRGVKVIGATAHYVTEELDQGPIIDQDVVRVSHRDGVDDLVRKGRDLEKSVLGRAVDLHLDHRVLVYGGKTVVFD